MKRLFILLAISALPAAALAVKFDHSAHLAYVDDGKCSVCHVEGAKSVVPERKVCLDCHDDAFLKDVQMPGLKTHGPVWALNHRPFAKADEYNCQICHEQSSCLECHKSRPADEFGEWGNNMTNVHRSDFQVTHPIAARTDQQLCKSCHENKFCVECHKDFNLGINDVGGLSHRRSFQADQRDLAPSHTGFTANDCDTCHSGAIKGKFVPYSQWAPEHARDARKNLATCQSCHPGGDVCLRCHSSKLGNLGINPHPKNWDDIKGRLDRASGGKTCRKCH